MASEAAIISWTPANWITIVLMVAITYSLAGFIARAVQQSQSNKAAG
jgi:FlaG/FlaF family flagellin (archaellin)